MTLNKDLMDELNHWKQQHHLLHRKIGQGSLNVEGLNGLIDALIAMKDRLPLDRGDKTNLNLACNQLSLMAFIVKEVMK